MRRLALVPILIAAVAAVLAMGLGIANAGVSEVARPVQGGITINILPIQASADVNDDLLVDYRDLAAIVRLLDSRPGGPAPEDINHDGVIDVLDLAITARYLGQEVRP